jgi:hypothetical protein
VWKIHSLPNILQRLLRTFPCIHPIHFIATHLMHDRTWRQVMEIGGIFQPEHIENPHNFLFRSQHMPCCTPFASSYALFVYCSNYIYFVPSHEHDSAPFDSRPHTFMGPLRKQRSGIHDEQGEGLTTKWIWLQIRILHKALHSFKFSSTLLVKLDIITSK